MGHPKTKPAPPPMSLKGKIILITGATSGLGAASALALARLSPERIYISGRRRSAASHLIAQIHALCPSDPVDAVFLPCDLADLSSVRAAANVVRARESRLDILMANAGVAAVPPGTTKDGYEVHFGTNHVGHALLIRLLMPLLREAEPRRGRVVVVTSKAYRAAVCGIDFEGVKGGGQWEVLGLWRWKRYAESKLANVVYARELARRFPEVVSVSVNPGFVETDMVARMRFCDRVGTRVLGFLSGGMVTSEEGARNQIWAATVDGEELANGGLYESVGEVCETMGRQAMDDGLAERLWEWTEKEIEGWLDPKVKCVLDSQEAEVD